MPINPTYSNDVGARDGSVVQFTWVLVTATPDGSPIKIPEWADNTFVATGTWGGATLTLEGSADGSTWVSLNAAAGGTAATATANKAITLIERPLYLRPNLTTPGAGATITVTALCRRATPLRT